MQGALVLCILHARPQQPGKGSVEAENKMRPAHLQSRVGSALRAGKMMACGALARMEGCDAYVMHGSGQAYEMMTKMAVMMTKMARAKQSPMPAGIPMLLRGPAHHGSEPTPFHSSLNNLEVSVRNPNSWPSFGPYPVPHLPVVHSCAACMTKLARRQQLLHRSNLTAKPLGCHFRPSQPSAPRLADFLSRRAAPTTLPPTAPERTRAAHAPQGGRSHAPAPPLNCAAHATIRSTFCSNSSISLLASTCTMPSA